MTTAEIDQVLAHIRAQMDLDSETEHEVLEEIRSHLEEAVAAAQAQGLDEQAALAEAAARFGVEEVGVELQQVHAGRGTADAASSHDVAASSPPGCRWCAPWCCAGWSSPPTAPPWGGRSCSPARLSG